MNTNHFTITADLPCSAETGFQAWLSSQTHAAMINGTATIDPKFNGAFSIWDDTITGTTTLIDNEHYSIEQTWHYNYPDWPKNEPSLLKLTFQKKTATTCILKIEHTNIPKHYSSELKEGWHEYYIEPMITYFQQHPQPLPHNE